jgi:hypothetical protein
VALQGFLRYLLKRPDIRTSRILSDFLAADEMMSQSTTPIKYRPSLAGPSPTCSRHLSCENASLECETAEAKRTVARRLDLATIHAVPQMCTQTRSSSIRKSMSADALPSLESNRASVGEQETAAATPVINR